MNIDVFELTDDESITKIRESCSQNDKTVHILDYKSHAMYITDLNKILRKHPCQNVACSLQHMRSLETTLKIVIKRFVATPTRYRPKGNFIKGLLMKYDINDCDHYMDHYIVYNFEAILKIRNFYIDDITRYTHDHVPVSVSVYAIHWVMKIDAL